MKGYIWLRDISDIQSCRLVHLGDNLGLDSDEIIQYRLRWIL